MGELKDLEDFRACLWEVASAPRHIVDWAHQVAGGHAGEVAHIETCQRIEVYGLGSCDCASQRRLQGKEALGHLAEVAAGLHSAVLGESQVMGQVRGGLTFASDGVRRVASVAVASARELRRAAGLEADVGTLLDQALDLAGVAPGGGILILGTGHQARATARRAAALDFPEIVIAGRSEPARMWLGGHHYAFCDLQDVALQPRPDVVAGCLGEAAGEFRLGIDLPVPRRLALDLGTPRNFAGAVDGALITIGDLLEADNVRHAAERAALRRQLHGIVERRLEMMASDSTTPVGALRQSVEQVRRRHVERLARLHPEVAQATLDTITRSLVNQLFHAPSERLRQLDDPELQDLVATLFGPADGEALE